MAHHKQGLTHWRGGRERSRLLSLGTWHITNEDSLARGRNRLVSLETWHDTNKDSYAGGEKERGAGW